MCGENGENGFNKIELVRLKRSKSEETLIRKSLGHSPECDS